MSQFELEVKQVLSPRDQGLNIRKISNLLNKTQSWVYARTQHEALKPFLLNHVGIHLFLIDIDHMRFLDAQAFKEEDERRKRDQSDSA